MHAHDLKTTDGLTVKWYEFAKGDSQPPIILHHGYMSYAKQHWLDTGIVDKLKPFGRTIIGIDARGHGASDKPHDQKFYGEEKMAGDVMQLVSEQGFDQYDFCGFSMGGMVASRLGTLDKRLRRLVITGVGEGILLFGGPDKRAIQMEDLAEGLLADDPSGYSERIQNWRTIIKENGGDPKAMAAQALCFGQSSIPVEKISVPTLVIGGELDDLAPNPDVLAKAIPGAKLQMVPGDHGQSLESAEYADALVKFLR